MEREKVSEFVKETSAMPTSEVKVDSEVMESDDIESDDNESTNTVSTDTKSTNTVPTDTDSVEGEVEEGGEESEQTNTVSPIPSSEDSSSSPITTDSEITDSEITTDTNTNNVTPLVVKDEISIYADPTESMPIDVSTSTEEPPKEYAEDSPNSPEPSNDNTTDITPNRPSTRYRPRFGRRFGRNHVSNSLVDSSYFPQDHVSDALVASLIQRTANQERKVLNLLPRKSRSLASIISNRVDRLRPQKHIPARLVQIYQQMTRGNEGTPLRNAAKIRRRSKNSEFLVVRKFRGNEEQREVSLTNRTEPRGSEIDVTAIMVST